MHTDRTKCVTYSRAAIWSWVSTVPRPWWTCCKILRRDKEKEDEDQTWLDKTDFHFISWVKMCRKNLWQTCWVFLWSTFDLWTQNLCRPVVLQWPALIPPEPSPSPVWTPLSLPGRRENCHCQDKTEIRQSLKPMLVVFSGFSCYYTANYELFPVNTPTYSTSIPETLQLWQLKRLLCLPGKLHLTSHFMSFIVGFVFHDPTTQLQHITTRQPHS